MLGAVAIRWKATLFVWALPRDCHSKAKSALPRKDKLSIYESKYTLRYDNNDVGRVFNGNMTYFIVQMSNQTNQLSRDFEC